MLKRLAFILLLLVTGSLAFGQQLPLYSQYLYNKYLINPAVAGSDGYTSISLTAREQWVGYAGAPRTFSLSFQSRILKKSFIQKQTRIKRAAYRPKSDGKVGFGGYIFTDRNGLMQRTGVQFSYSYHTWLRQSTQLSFGLAGSGYYFKIDETQLNFEDPNDPWMNNDLRKGIFVPDFSVGVYLLNARYNLGFSAEQLSESAAKFGNTAYKNFSMERQYYLFGSYDFDAGINSVIQPSFLAKMSEQLKPQLDIGATWIYKEDFWAGLAYRTSGVIITTIGVKYQNIFFGYSYDFTLSEIQRLTYGTHEITLAMKFGDNSRRYRWLDRY
jgi:type IX secretion system PorP/SprF family membrane protein